MKNKVFPLHNFLVNELPADFIHPSLEKPLSMTNLSFWTFLSPSLCHFLDNNVPMK